MKTKALVFVLCLVYVLNYDRGAAINYAAVHWNNPNHSCDGYTSCSPYSYWGDEDCGYGGDGGDCANFVSQCLLAGGHPPLNQGECRGYPCGVEEIGATRLGNCLENTYGWESSCDYLLSPPDNIQAGDVLIYHAGSCWDYDAHAVLVLPDYDIACHSNMHYGLDYTYMGTYMPYYEWLHNPN